MIQSGFNRCGESSRNEILVQNRKRYGGPLELVKRGAAEVATTPLLENLECRILDKHLLTQFLLNLAKLRGR